MLLSQYHNKLKEIIKAKQLWRKFSDIPINTDDEIEKRFEHFEIGTSRFDVFDWFENKFDISVAKDLMNLKQTN